MTHKLKEHGFVDVRRAAFGDSGDPRFAAVENEGRFTDAIAMHCTRPISGATA